MVALCTDEVDKHIYHISLSLKRWVSVMAILKKKISKTFFVVVGNFDVTGILYSV